MTGKNISNILDKIALLSKSIKKEKNSDATPISEQIFERYQKICYIYGKYLDKEEHSNIARMIYQADLEMTPGLFLSMIIFSAIGAAAVMALISVFIFALPISPFYSPNAPLYIAGLTLLTGIAAGGGFPFYLQNQISNKKMDIERNLPYALAFMSILASSGTTPLDILKSVANENYGHISREFSKVLFRVEILGEDAVTAMNALVSNTPSDPFRDICIDISNLIYGGGGLSGYLNAKSKELMNIRRQTDKEFVESLGVFGEGYLGGVIMVLTLAILGIVITGALGIQIGPLKTDEMFFILIYVAVPIINLVFLQILAVKYSTSV
jgi:flagellar protein FlaJ